MMLMQSQVLHNQQLTIAAHEEAKRRMASEIDFLRELERQHNVALFNRAVDRLDNSVAQLGVLMQDTWPEANLDHFGVVTRDD